MGTRSHATRNGALAGTLLALVLGALSAWAAPHEGQLRQEFHQTYALSQNGRVELQNLNGKVQITGWDRNEVKVDAVKYADDQQRLDEAKIEVESHPDSIVIRTRYPENGGQGWHGHHDNPATVDYTIMVPSGARLDEIKLVNGALEIDGVNGEIDAASVNGAVTGRNLGGKVELSTVNGRVAANLTRLGDNRVRMKSVNGAVELTMPSDAQAEVEAHTMNGSISNDYGLPISKRHMVPGRNLRGRLGNGGVNISLETLNGSITIRHANDGKPLSKATSLLPHEESDDQDTL
jgi:hypothetical protein